MEGFMFRVQRFCLWVMVGRVFVIDGDWVGDFLDVVGVISPFQGFMCRVVLPGAVHRAIDDAPLGLAKSLGFRV